MDKLEVLNKNTARVYVRTSGSGGGSGVAGQTDGGMQPSGTAAPGQSPSQYKYYFNVGSIDSFERKMEEAQQSFGLGLGEEVGFADFPPLEPGRAPVGQSWDDWRSPEKHLPHDCSAEKNPVASLVSVHRSGSGLVKGLPSRVCCRRCRSRT